MSRLHLENVECTGREEGETFTHPSRELGQKKEYFSEPEHKQQQNPIHMCLHVWTKHLKNELCKCGATTERRADSLSGSCLPHFRHCCPPVKLK